MSTDLDVEVTASPGMTAWAHVPLSEIARPVSRPLVVQSGSTYRTIGVKWWGEGAYERQTIDGADTAAKTLSLVHEGDLIINKIWVRNGSTAIATAGVDGCAASGEFPTFELDATQVLARWLHWQTKTKAFWGKCDHLSRGTSGKNRITPAQFLTITVPLPSLTEQKRIVARIEDLTSRIEKIHELRQQSVRDVDRLLLDAYFLAIEGAPSRPMVDVAPLCRRPVHVDPLLIYRELGIRSFGKGTFHKPPVSGAELGTKRIFTIEPGDLLFNIVFAWEGAVAVAQEADQGRVGSHRFLTCIPKAGIVTASFLRFHFLTAEGLGSLSTASPGGAGRNRTLGIKALEAIHVPVPSMATQRWFDDLQTKMAQLRTIQGDTDTQLQAFVLAIVDKAFKGEL